jgi:nicotinamide-nucleotide amidase
LLPERIFTDMDLSNETPGLKERSHSNVPLKIEVINTGSELLLGTVRDAHLAWLAGELFPLGFRIGRQTTVPDGEAIREALQEAFERSDLIIVSGGLGPTSDDITREVASELTRRRLLPHAETLERIHERCRKRGFTFQERMGRQAMVPEGALVLTNENGTAPGLHLPAREGQPDVFLLPGPPRELQPMARAYLMPFLREIAGERSRQECRIYRITGMGESLVEAKVGLALTARGDLEVGYCARPNEVDFRLIGPKEILDEVDPLVREAVGENLVTEGEDALEEVVMDLLKSRGATIVTAESCTGGLLASRITDIPGASEVFLQGFVTYSNASKTSLLGVPSDLISLHGAVSEPVVRAMAEGALRVSGASHALATTGIAGPDGGSPEKPVGTVWIALASQQGVTEAWVERFPADRMTFKRMTTQSALDRLRRRLRLSDAPKDEPSL